MADKPPVRRLYQMRLESKGSAEVARDFKRVNDAAGLLGRVSTATGRRIGDLSKKATELSSSIGTLSNIDDVTSALTNMSGAVSLLAGTAIGGAVGAIGGLVGVIGGLLDDTNEAVRAQEEWNQRLEAAQRQFDATRTAIESYASAVGETRHTLEIDTALQVERQRQLKEQLTGQADEALRQLLIVKESSIENRRAYEQAKKVVATAHLYSEEGWKANRELQSRLVLMKHLEEVERALTEQRTDAANRLFEIERERQNLISDATMEQVEADAENAKILRDIEARQRKAEAEGRRRAEEERKQRIADWERDVEIGRDRAIRAMREADAELERQRLRREDALVGAYGDRFDELEFAKNDMAVAAVEAARLNAELAETERQMAILAAAGDVASGALETLGDGFAAAFAEAILFGSSFEELANAVFKQAAFEMTVVAAKSSIMALFAWARYALSGFTDLSALTAAQTYGLTAATAGAFAGGSAAGAAATGGLRGGGGGGGGRGSADYGLPSRQDMVDREGRSGPTQIVQNFNLSGVIAGERAERWIARAGAEGLRAESERRGGAHVVSRAVR